MVVQNMYNHSKARNSLTPHFQMFESKFDSFLFFQQNVSQTVGFCADAIAETTECSKLSTNGVYSEKLIISLEQKLCTMGSSVLFKFLELSLKKKQDYQQQIPTILVN